MRSGRVLILFSFLAVLCLPVISVNGEEASVRVYTRSERKISRQEKTEEQKEKLISIDSLSDITDLVNGAQKTVYGLELPRTVEIETTKDYYDAQIEWDLKKIDYRPEDRSRQTFTVTGEVILPDEVENPDDISTEIRVQVTVNEREPIEADWEENRIDGLTTGMVFTTEDRICFEAIGDGMDLTDPIKGDTRYLPVSWMVLENRFFDPEPPYEASFRMAEAGGFTLLVTFEQQMYDGENWIDNDEIYQREVNFNVRAAEADEDEKEEGNEERRTISNSEQNRRRENPAVWILVLTAVVVVAVLLLKHRKQ